MKTMSDLTYGSLFTGAGGFDLGFDQAGYDCRWQVEWNQHCQQVLQHRWPTVPKHHDIQDVSGSELEPVDVITYGSPCQDLSIAGRRTGIEGNRSSMFFEATRIFQEMRSGTNAAFPRIAIWENVPGALTSNSGNDFRTVLQTLDDIGALAQWWYVLDAQHFGIPQRRRRIFVISVFDPAIADRIGSGDILPVSARCQWDSRAHDNKKYRSSSKAAQRIDESNAIAFNWANGGGYGTANVGLGITIDGTGPLSTSQVPAVVHGDQPARKLTPIECERLMGWPDDHTLHRADGKTTSNSHRYKMCGNGVASPVAQWIATNITHLLTGEQ